MWARMFCQTAETAGIVTRRTGLVIASDRKVIHSTCGKVCEQVREEGAESPSAPHPEQIEQFFGIPETRLKTGI
ncbi:MULTISPECIES: hypothetical protein [unclassified Wenzhouxiangella]|uniref:hypothetical protein n=1 Tax=unclassified Wenzhouxiangella TaxID=2613841 RepID=UPI0011C02279|nr:MULTISPECIES: hypothetical protein [unclassified Wenzhouxiangella]